MSHANNFPEGTQPEYYDLLCEVENYLGELCPEGHANEWVEAFCPEECCTHQFAFKRELAAIVGAILNQYKDEDQDPNG